MQPFFNEQTQNRSVWVITSIILDHHYIKHFICARSDCVVSIVALRASAPPYTVRLHLSSIRSKNCAAEAENALRLKEKKNLFIERKIKPG